jgi:pilus assembly protein Flp/PilA
MLGGFPMISTLMKNLVEDQSGATAIEYGMILALVALAIIGSLSAMAGETIQMWNNVARDVVAAIGG